MRHRLSNKLIHLRDKVDKYHKISDSPTCFITIDTRQNQYPYPSGKILPQNFSHNILCVIFSADWQGCTFYKCIAIFSPNLCVNCDKLMAIFSLNFCVNRDIFGYFAVNFPSSWETIPFNWVLFLFTLRNVSLQVVNTSPSQSLC